MNKDDCNGDDYDLGEDKKGGSYLNIGLSVQYLAWPKPASQRAFYVLLGYTRAATMKRLSSERWEFRSGRQPRLI